MTDSLTRLYVLTEKLRACAYLLPAELESQSQDLYTLANEFDAVFDDVPTIDLVKDDAYERIVHHSSDAPHGRYYLGPRSHLKVKR